LSGAKSKLEAARCAESPYQGPGIPIVDRHPQYDVLGSAQRVSERARFVRIDGEAINRWADRVDPETIRPAPRPPELRFAGPSAEAARWVLLVDCLNFCFWSDTEPAWAIEYEGKQWRRYLALVAALRRAVAGSASWLTAERWACATAADVEDVFAGRGRIPMFDDRVKVLNETGRVLLARYGGEALHVAETARFDAARIAATVCDEFDAFRDVHAYQGMQVPILKRAQIFASDLAAGLADNDGPAVTNIEAITAFADYRIPQMLRHLKILVLADDLESRIENGRPIEASSDEEIELRAGSIWSVELMVRALCTRRHAQHPAWIVDEHLWHHAHDPEVTIQHHKTITWYY